jgi:DNA-binding MarR family transcriptional regulator
VPRIKRDSSRRELLDALAQVGREHSDATVFFHATMADRLDLHPTDYKALSVLERLGAMSAGEIGRHCGIATASVTNLIDRLEHKGFLRRLRDGSDRRRILVEPVADRIAPARGLFRSTSRSLARLYERYSDRDLALIADFLSRNAERLRAETLRLGAAGDGDAEHTAKG